MFWYNGVVFVQNVASLLSAFVPAAILLVFIYTRVPQPHENPIHIVVSFVSGMTGALFAFFIFQALEVIPVYRALMRGEFVGELETGAFALLVIGPIEETLKLAAVVVTGCRLGFIVRPVDALVFGSATALGFGAAENWYAMWATGGPDFGRALLVPLLHVLFASFSGWGIVTSRYKGGASWSIYAGLTLASVYHGLYNYLEFRGGLWHFLTLPLVASLYVFFSRALGSFSRLPRYRRSRSGRTFKKS